MMGKDNKTPESDELNIYFYNKGVLFKIISMPEDIRDEEGLIKYESCEDGSITNIKYSEFIRDIEPCVDKFVKVG